MTMLLRTSRRRRKEVLELPQPYHEAFIRFGIDEAAEAAIDEVRALNREVDRVEPWKLLKSGQFQILHGFQGVVRAHCNSDGRAETDNPADRPIRKSETIRPIVSGRYPSISTEVFSVTPLSGTP